jgi:large subunit ribosomal protein L4
MLIDKYSLDGKVIGQVDLPDGIFKADINDELIYELIKAANANLRQGTHMAKERSAIRGGGAKPWKQKGTGRARQGSIRSPQWRGGGTIFGPRPLDYRIDLPKSIRRKAYISLFSMKAKEGMIKVVEEIAVKEGKTKEMALLGKNLVVNKGVLITVSEDRLLKRAIRNIPWFSYNNVKRLSSRDIFYSQTLLITEGALSALNDMFAKGKK